VSIGKPGLLRFEEGYFERPWGGAKLRTLYGKPIPSDTPIGEAWLVADHPRHESVVADGPHRGKTLPKILEEDARGVLGSRARLTPHGRFPLTLKILDARDILSVQVHPDDACAKELGEPDIGKTEMWYVLQADARTELICGLDPLATSATLMQAIADGSADRLMTRFQAKEGDAFFVPAGTVHAIGPGLVLAEIQQNSDLIYRIYDWGRVDAHGRPRELHIDKALKAIHFGSRGAARTRPVAHTSTDVHRTVLAFCRHFIAERIEVEGEYACRTEGETFHILLATRGALRFSCEENEQSILPGQALLAPGCLTYVGAHGKGAYLDYYVPSGPDQR